MIHFEADLLRSKQGIRCHHKIRQLVGPIAPCHTAGHLHEVHEAGSHLRQAVLDAVRPCGFELRSSLRDGAKMCLPQGLDLLPLLFASCRSVSRILSFPLGSVVRITTCTISLFLGSVAIALFLVFLFGVQPVSLPLLVPPHRRLGGPVRPCAVVPSGSR